MRVGMPTCPACPAYRLPAGRQSRQESKECDKQLTIIVRVISRNFLIC